MDSTPESGSSEAGDAPGPGVERVADAAVEVAGTIAEHASQVGGEVASVAGRLVDDAKTQVRGGAETQVRLVADGLDLLCRQARALAVGRPGEAGPLVDYLQDAADGLGDLAERLHRGGLDGTVVDIKRFARSRPAVFLTGSALAGLAIGRLIRNEAAAVQARLAQNQSFDGEPSGGPAEIGPDSAPGSDPVLADPVSAVPVGDGEQ